jgi:hypothetical protein
VSEEVEELKVKWSKVVFDNGDPIIRWIDLVNGTMYRIIAFKSYRPRHGLFVGIERKGCFLFRIGHPMVWTYIDEKLTIGNESDSRILADWINVQCDQEFPQQGSYNKKYLYDVEPYPYGGEMIEMPLAPDIIMESIV